MNALVIAAAISLGAVALLLRSETARAGRNADLMRWQMEHYLDSAEALVIGRLRDDVVRTLTDDYDEVWARDATGVDIDRGKLSLRVVDAQGLFNLNWIAADETGLVAEEFHRAALRNGFSPSLADAIIAHLSGAGALNMIDELGALDRVGPVALADLRRFATAIPGDRALNVNTAGEDVLRALIPSMNAALYLEVERNRPFETANDFRDLMLDKLKSEAFDAVPFSRMTVASRWFELNISVALEGRRASRRTMLERVSPPFKTKVFFRLRQPG